MAEIDAEGRVFEGKSNKADLIKTLNQPIPVAGGPWRPTSLRPAPEGTSEATLEYLAQNPTAEIDALGVIYDDPKDNLISNYVLTSGDEP